MHKINIKKVDELLLKHNKKQFELATYISMKTSALCSALNGKRPFPMTYVFGIADFFAVSPRDIVIEFNESITTKQNNNQLQEKKDME